MCSLRTEEISDWPEQKAQLSIIISLAFETAFIIAPMPTMQVLSRSRGLKSGPSGFKASEVGKAVAGGV